MGRFFTETFRHRTGQPLAIVTGEADTAALVAMASEDRPSLFFANNPELSPWVTEDAIRDKGAVVVWPVSDNAGMPPAAIKSRFPGLVPEVPRSFDRPVQGRLSLYRIGWAVIRPRGQPAGAAPSSRAAASRPR